MNQKIKISQLPAKGSNLAAADLLEIAEFTGTGYISKSITGQEIIDAIPVPPSGITIGSTAIASGVVGRVLFEGAGNVVQESSSLFWDATNNRLGVGTSTPNSALEVVDTGAASFVAPARFLVPNNNVSGRVSQFYLGTSMTTLNSIAWNFHYQGNGSTANYQSFGFNGIANPALAMFGTLNVGINTTTDAGFRLDVNGTARVSGLVTLNSNIILNAASATNSIVHSSTFSSSKFSVLEQLSGQNIGGFIINSGTGESRFGSFRNGGGYYTTFYVNNAELIRLSTSNNVLINTTTDAGFRLDVNGTARATQITATTFGGSFNVGSVNVVDFGDGLRIGYSSSVSKISLFTNSGTQGLQVNNGSVSIGPQLTPNASAILDLTSTTKGFLPPRMTTTQRNAIASPVAGLMVYDTTLNVIMYYNGSMWI